MRIWYRVCVEWWKEGEVGYGSVLDLVDGSLRAKGEDPWVLLQGWMDAFGRWVVGNYGGS